MAFVQNLSPFGLFLGDLRNAIGEGRRLLALSWYDFAADYRRTYFGALWQTIETAMFVTVITLLLGTAFGRPYNEYAVYVAVGVVGWNILSNSLGSGPRVFLSHAGTIQNMPTNLLGLVVRRIGTQFFQFCFDFPVAFLAVAILAPTIEAGFNTGIESEIEAGFRLEAITSLFALVTFFINAGWIFLFFGCVGVFFRGLRFALPSIMRFMFFTTPIFWYGDRGFRSIVATYNPLAHYLEIFRGPLIGNEIDLVSWTVVGIFTVLGWVLAIITYLRVRASLVFWL